MCRSLAIGNIAQCLRGCVHLICRGCDRAIGDSQSLPIIFWGILWRRQGATQCALQYGGQTARTFLFGGRINRLLPCHSRLTRFE